MKTIFNNKKKAFTLIELLIVIAIIGILFIVLVSKVDFATDKAKASGVQTDFRSFQMAFDQVARENAGFASLGWNTGDVNGDRIRNSYDKGDNGAGGGIAYNGIQDGGEVFVGSKEYGETWTNTFTLVNPDDNADASGFVALENAINANLDPKLHITITPDVDGTALTGNATITMANQARDPWKNEYHGVFITNAVRDGGADRGAIVMYSNGANGKWGSAHDITNGVVTVGVPGNNVNGKDDYSFVSCFTFTNGYGEVLNSTTGFSNNQSFKGTSNNTTPSVIPGGTVDNAGGAGNGEQTPTPIVYEMLSGENNVFDHYQDVTIRSAAPIDKFVCVKVNGVEINPRLYSKSEGSTVITIKNFYFAYLNVYEGIRSGTIEIVSTDGSAKATYSFVVNDSIHGIDSEGYGSYWCDVCNDWSCLCLGYHLNSTGGSYCEDCGEPWCYDGDCVDSDDDTFCDCCGKTYHEHHDTDNGYCDVCNRIWCYDVMCTDADKDGYCDCCWCEYECPHVVAGDDCTCRECGVVSHRIEDGKCSKCGYEPCYDMNGNKPCYDNNSDCMCDSCGWDIHVDSNRNGYCDKCNSVYCSDGGPCLDTDGDHRCDYCEYWDCTGGYHSDDTGCNGYCDGCGIPVCYDYNVHHDENEDGRCDCCAKYFHQFESNDYDAPCLRCGELCWYSEICCSDNHDSGFKDENEDSICDMCGTCINDHVDEDKDDYCDKCHALDAWNEF